MVELRAVYELASRAPSLVHRGEVPEDVRAFLVGGNGSDDVLHALYDHVLDEAVPRRLIEILAIEPSALKPQ
jgi:hypothetical protein